MEKFHQLRIDKVLTTFHVKERFDCEQLNLLISASGQISTFEDTTLNIALDRYRRIGRGWNEEELKMLFISTILNLADPYIQDVCKPFFERPLSGNVNNYELNVKTDFMIASYNEGGEPKKPYFFLQEFKQKQLWGRTDPQGQMLAAMLLAQESNADGGYLYGCFVNERHWFFATLKGLDYCVSPSFDASKKTELLQIVFILRKLKELILNR